MLNWMGVYKSIVLFVLFSVVMYFITHNLAVWMLKKFEGSIKIDNPEKLATVGTQTKWRRQSNQKHNTICVGHQYTQTNINNINKTWTLLETKQPEVKTNQNSRLCGNRSGHHNTEHRMYSALITLRKIEYHFCRTKTRPYSIFIVVCVDIFLILCFCFLFCWRYCSWFCIWTAHLHLF